MSSKLTPGNGPGFPFGAQPELIGADELRQKLAGLVEKLSDSETRAVFKAAAGAIRDKARLLAPRGRNIGYSLLPSGSRTFPITFERQRNRLRKAIVAFASKAVKGRDPAAFARVNVFTGLYTAPHAHLVEFGTKPRQAKGKFLVFRNQSGTGLIFARRVAAMKAQPFFGPAVQQAGPQALERAAEKTAKVLQAFIDRR